MKQSVQGVTIFAAAILPITLHEVLRVEALSRLAGGSSSLQWPISAASCFYVSAIIGYVATISITPHRTTIARGYRVWLVPFASALVLSGLSIAGTIEWTGDQVARMIGWGHDYEIIAVAVVGATMIATSVGRLIAGLIDWSRKENQIA